MSGTVNVMPILLDAETHTVNVVISKIGDSTIINGTGRDTYIVSIPEWKWSTESGAPQCSESYWRDNLNGNIEKVLEKYVPEISEKLSKVDMRF